MDCHQRAFGDLFKPEIVISDYEKALVNAVHSRFPETKQLRCVWHINKDILKNHRNSCNSHEASEDFIKRWNATIGSKTEQGFFKSWEKLSKEIPVELVRYLESVWMPVKEMFARPWAKETRTRSVLKAAITN